MVAAFLVLGLFFWRGRSTGEEAETAQVTRGAIEEVLSLSGTLRAVEYAQLRFPATGKLGWVGVVEGQEVKKGQALLKLDTTSLYADLQQAESSLRDAEAGLAVVYDEVKGNDNDETLEQKELRTTAEVVKDNAYRNLTKARFNLANATLFAPFDGFVTHLASNFVGVNTLPTEIQVEILNPATIYFEVAADQTEIINIHEGQAVTIFLDPFEERELQGEVTYVSLTPIPGEIGSVYEIRVGFGNKSIDIDQIRIGMTGEARFLLNQKQDVLKLPSGFVKTDNKGRFVNLNRVNNKVHIEVGLEGEDELEVSGDINEGDTVFD